VAEVPSCHRAIGAPMGLFGLFRAIRLGQPVKSTLAARIGRRGWGSMEKKGLKRRGAHLRFSWSADILVRFGVDRTPKADKNVRAPITKVEGVGKI
jgi:hypothetical protein